MGKAIDGLLGAEPKETKEEPGKKPGRPKANHGNRLILNDVPTGLMEWLRAVSAESFRTVEGQILFTLNGCMNANLAKKEVRG